MNSQYPRLIGGSLLISGSCIGAGMLGLPVITGYLGFLPSVIAFLVTWGFMTLTGLLLAEVNIYYGKPTGLISLAGATLGRFGKGVTWFLFLFLFYSLTVAYILGSGAFFTDILESLAGITISPLMGSLLFTLLFGVLVFRGTRSVDLFNRVLMVGLLFSYFSLIVTALPAVDQNITGRGAWSYMMASFPGLVIAFGFHNVVPTLYRYLEGDRKMIRFSILIGCFIPLIVYLLFEYVILGVLPIEGEHGLRSAFEGGLTATQSLSNYTGYQGLRLGARIFAFFALATSFLAQSLSFVDFLSDGLNLPKVGMKKFLLCALVFVPPFLMGMIYPQIFYICLEYAGAFGATVLFGILPILMATKLRAKNTNYQPLVPGGTKLLFLLFVFACYLVVLGIARQADWLQLYGV